MKHILTTDDTWFKIRSEYVTASEVASLVGHNSWTSAAQIKKAKLEGSTFNGNAATKLGQILEPIVVQLTNTALKTEFVLYETLEEGKAFFTKGWLGATPDACSADGSTLLECKTTKPANYVKYALFPPLNYLLQLQCQLYCTGLDVGQLSIMSTDLTQHGSDLVCPLVVYQMQYSEVICEILNEEADRLLNNDEAFRVKSSYKKQIELILNDNLERVYW